MVDSKTIKGCSSFEYQSYKKQLFKLYNYAIKKHGKPDLILANFSFYAGRAAVDIAKKNSLPCITIEHYGYLLGERITRYQAKALGYTLNNSTKYICVSHALKNAVMRHSRNDSVSIDVIPNAIAPEYKYYAPSKKNVFTFLVVGNLYIGKRIQMLVKAFSEAFEKDKDVQLRIVGDGNQAEIIKKLIEFSGEESRIVMLGRLQKDKILEEYKRCDCFVLPSEHETFGIVYREAMAVGRPIITTNHQGFEGNWSDNWGIRIAVDDKEALRESLIYMRENYQTYNNELISQECLSMYSELTVMSELEKVINECVGVK